MSSALRLWELIDTMPPAHTGKHRATGSRWWRRVRAASTGGGRHLVAGR